MKNVTSKNETNRIGTKNQQAFDANHSSSVPHWQKASRIHYEAVFSSTVNGSCVSK